MDRKIGFIGLGTMGGPMALNIHRAGYQLGVFNRSARKTAPFHEKGIPVYETPKALAAESDVVIIMVTGPQALLDVLQQDEGVLAEMQAGTIIVNMSTVSPEATADAAELVATREGEFLDVPVSGTKKPAEDGTLVILAGGNRQTIRELTPLLNTMGKEVIYCGDIGQATHMKLMINLLLGSMMQGLAEALTFGKKLGLDLDAMMQTIGSGGLSSPFYTAKGNAIRQGNFTKNFPVNLMLKDLDLALQAGKDNGVALPQTAINRELFTAANAKGLGEEDMAAVIKVIEDIAAITVRDDG